MAQIKYKTIGSGATKDDPVRCDLPSFQFLNDLGTGVWLIDVPTEYLTNGLIDNSKIRALYDYSALEWNNISEKSTPAQIVFLQAIKTKDYASNQVMP